jgi:hypothetical protein
VQRLARRNRDLGGEYETAAEVSRRIDQQRCRAAAVSVGLGVLPEDVQQPQNRDSRDD